MGVYLRIENGYFGFIVNGFNQIYEKDIAITEEEYNKFFELQGQGKQFKLKEVATGTTLFDYIEEYIPVVDTAPQPPSLEERMEAMEELLLAMI